MNSIRNLYIYLVCFITSQIVVWTTIYLGRNLLIGRIRDDALAWQIALLVISVPLLLIHWLWAERLAKQDSSERLATMRSLYLYLSLTTFLISLLGQAYLAVRNVLYLLDDIVADYFSRSLSENLIAIVILFAVWVYHDLVRHEDETMAESYTKHVQFQRFYRWFFTVVTLGVGASGLASLGYRLLDGHYSIITLVV
jgi:hypothetical protein